MVIHGKSIHPGSARGKMVNAALLAMEFHQLLPVYETPATTDGYEGFYHLTHMAGEVEEAKLSYIIRDHDAEKFQRRCAFFQKAADFLNEKYGAGTAEATVTESYRNMKEKILPHMDIVDAAKAAMEASRPRWCPSAAAPTAPGSPTRDFRAPTSAPAARISTAASNSSPWRIFKRWPRSWSGSSSTPPGRGGNLPPVGYRRFPPGYADRTAPGRAGINPAPTSNPRACP